jgi:hypothetical protein
MRTFEASESETARSDGSALVTQLLFQFRIGTVRNAGTAANVSLRIGDHRFDWPAMPESESESESENERGGIYTGAFPIHELRMTLDQLRAAEICLSHEDTGKNPGWYIDSVLVQVGLNRPTANPDTIRWLTYKRWQGMGCLAADESGIAVRLQKRAFVTSVVCAHRTPEPGCQACRRRWPYHPGRRCRCTGCGERLLPHSR